MMNASFVLILYQSQRLNTYCSVSHDDLLYGLTIGGILKIINLFLYILKSKNDK